jgi:hypothetical protein
MKRIERAAFYKTRKDGQPAAFVNVEAIWLLHGGRCCCDQVRDPGCGGKPMDPEKTGAHPDAPTLAHVEARRRRLSGSHGPENCRWWRAECNAAMAKIEARDHGVGSRMAVDFSRKDEPQPELVATRMSCAPKGWQKKPDGYVSKLSKKHRDQVKARMGDKR